MEKTAAPTHDDGSMPSATERVFVWNELERLLVQFAAQELDAQTLADQVARLREPRRVHVGEVAPVTNVDGAQGPSDNAILSPPIDKARMTKALNLLLQAHRRGECKHRLSFSMLECFLRAGYLVDLVHALIELEIEKTDSPSFLFRRMESHRVVSHSLLLLGRRYLWETLHVIVEEVAERSICIELDIRDDAAEQLENARLLDFYCQRTVNAIVRSEVLLTVDLRRIFAFVTQGVQQKWPRTPNGGRDVLSPFSDSLHVFSNSG